MGEMIQFPAGDTNGSGYLALPPSGTGPGLLLMHAWWGLTDFFKIFAGRLASEGFVVLAPDLYDGATATTIPDAERLINNLDYRRAIQDEMGATNCLLALPAMQGDRIGAIGFSMGGAYATWLGALRPEVAAVVLFYGGSEQEPNYASRTNAAFLGHFADPDDYEPIEMARKLETDLRNAGKEATFHTYPGAKHWFFESNRPDAYDPALADIAWQRTLDFLHLHLDRPQPTDTDSTTQLQSTPDLLIEDRDKKEVRTRLDTIEPQAAPEIQYATLVRADQERAYDAFATVDGLNSWFTAESMIGNPPDGELWMRWEDWGPDHETVEVHGTVLAAERPLRFAFRWWDTDPEAATSVEARFESRPDGTVVRLREQGFRDSEAARRNLLTQAAGWGEALTLLKFYVEHGLRY